MSAWFTNGIKKLNIIIQFTKGNVVLYIILNYKCP